MSCSLEDIYNFFKPIKECHIWIVNYGKHRELTLHWENTPFALVWIEEQGKEITLKMVPD